MNFKKNKLYLLSKCKIKFPLSMVSGRELTFFKTGIYFYILAKNKKLLPLSQRRSINEYYPIFL